MPDEDKRETADALMRSVEQELALKRQQWQRDRQKQHSGRLVFFSLLSLLILAALIALFFVLTRANEMREQRARPVINTNPSAHSSP